VVRDPARNFLWGYLGLREDDPKNRAAPPAVPDCADLPYYLRATFAWKRVALWPARLQPGAAATIRPTAVPWSRKTSRWPATILSTAFARFLRLLANKVHSGSARTALDDDETDFYPVKLARDVLRPA